MTSPYPDESDERPGPVMFLEAGRPGRPRSTLTSESSNPSSSADPSQPRPESSTSPDPSWSTEPPPPPPYADESEQPSVSPGSDEPALTLGQMITRGLAGATEVAHNTATDDVGRAYGQWLATERELYETGEGAAGLLSRRIPAGPGSPDMADLIRIGISLASYGSRQYQTWKRVRAQRKAIALAAAQQADATTAAA